MATACYLGIQAVRSTAPSQLSVNSGQHASLSPDGRSTPLVLPPIDGAGKGSGSENGMQSARAIQQALMELQQSASTDQITSFTELARQTNFAILQAAIDENIPSQHIRITRQEERTSQFGAYTYQAIAVQAPASFLQTLHKTLGTWQTQAKLQSIQNNIYTVSIQGISTHQITLYTSAAQFNSQFGSSSAPAAADPVYPAQRSVGAPPKMVIVIDDLGASPKALERLIKLNFPVTCAFWPDAAHTRTGAQRAHAARLEILVHMPMEPIGYPRVKPGANALLHTMSRQQIITLVQNAIHKVPHAVGLNNHMGSKLTQDRQRTGYVLSVLKHNGLFMLDSVTHGSTVFYDVARQFSIPRFKRSVFLDADESPSAIMASLAKTERIAQLTGQAIAIGHPLPNTLAALEKWQHQRNKSIKIVRLGDLHDKGL